MGPTARIKEAAQRVLDQPGAGAVLVCVAATVLLLLVGGSCQYFQAARGPAVVAAEEGVEPEVRVRVARGVQGARLEGPRLLMAEADGHNPVLLRTPVIATATRSGVLVRDERGEQVQYDDEVTFSSGDAREPGEVPRILLDGRAFPGRVRLIVRDGPTLDGVNIVPLESYLPSVLAGEMLPNWTSLEAYSVQAVCARSYALQQTGLSRERGRHFDLESTTQDQVYTGVTQREVAIRAVQRTRGVVMTYRGQVLRAYYSSTCGGRPASAADTWPTGRGFEFNLLPPLQAHVRDYACHGSSLFRWTVERDLEDVTARFRAWGASNGSELARISRVRAIEPQRRTVTGRAARYAVVDTSGRRVGVTGEQLRLAFNYAAPGRPRPERDRLVRSGDMDFVFEGSQLTIQGRGFGHGVGMCQYCANAMGERGDDYKAMLTRFYPGVTIERIY
jgi:stage II sporulation protein D